MKNTYSAALALLLSFYCTTATTEPTEPDSDGLAFAPGDSEQLFTGEAPLSQMRNS